MAIDFVIPAHDEAETIGDVIRAISSSASAGRVIVVADACSDSTAWVARSLGAVVLEIDAHDKGSAMAAGLTRVRTWRVGFCDADLVGLQPWHVDELAATPGWSMAVGVRDSTVRLGWYPIGGERVLSVAVARMAELEGAGYESEARLAIAAKQWNIPIVDVPLAGLQHPTRGGERVLTRNVAVVSGWVSYLLRRLRG